MPIYGTTILTGLVEQQLARYPDVDWSVGLELLYLWLQRI